MFAKFQIDSSKTEKVVRLYRQREINYIYLYFIESPTFSSACYKIRVKLIVPCAGFNI